MIPHSVLKKGLSRINSRIPTLFLRFTGLTATRLIGERQKEKLNEEGEGYVCPKIVFVTATVDQTLEDEAKKLGAVGFVPKPFNLRQLETCMTELCRSLG